MKRLLAYISFNKKMLLLALGFAGVAGIVPIMALGGHQLVEVVDSTAFCTETCHSVHYPESVTFKESPHKEVVCAQCHVGTGVENLVRSKIRGLSDIIPAITKNYPIPIPTPLKDRRPSNETCEKCHSTDKFLGDIPRIKITYASDAANTRSTATRVLKVGGGKEEVASGIHWHNTAEVWYLPLDDKQLKIGWVATENSSGGITEYINPNLANQITPELIQQKKRLMDCVDCHNRTTHLFLSPDQLVDYALSDGSVDIALPFIKREAIKALVPQNDSLGQAYDKIDKIKDFYKVSYPLIFKDKLASIESAITKLKDIAKLTTFSDGLDWNTYRSNAGHDKPSDNMTVDFNAIALKGDSPGCFRCHGTLVKVDNTKPVPASGGAISSTGIKFITLDQADSRNNQLDAECESCHYTFKQPVNSPDAPATSHPIDRLDDCLACHSPTAARPFKSTHPWTTNEACNSCHQSAPKLITLPSSTPPADAKPIPHSLTKLEDCLSCHGSSGAKPFAKDHPWSTNDTCAACHKTGSTTAPQATSPPAQLAAEITHSITGLSNCSLCHGQSALAPLPADHAGRSDNLCTVCHKEAANITQNSAVLPQAKPISHSIVGLSQCSSCHKKGGLAYFPDTHVGRPDFLCVICHQSSPAAPPAPVLPTPPTTGAPQIPHALDNAHQDCLLCHGPSGIRPVTPTHAGRANDTCTSCHTSASTPPATLAAPTNLVAIAASATQVNLSWVDNSNDEVGFRIERATNNTFTLNLAGVMVAANTAGHNDTTVSGSATYYYRVFAYDSVGNLMASNVASATTPGQGVSPPAAPTSLTASAVSATQVNLTWVDNANNESGFRIERATNNNFTANSVNATVGANTTNYSATLLTGSTTYYFRVFANNSAGDSPASNTASATTTPAVNNAPVLSAIGNKSVNEGQLLTFTLSATDPDGGTLTYSASNLPSGSSFDAATRVFSWTPSFTQAGTYTAVHFQVSDGSLTDSEDITITVVNVNQPPVLSAIGNKSVNTGVLLTFTLSATDPDGGTLTYSASNLPSGSSFNAPSRVFSWTPGSTQTGSYTAVHFQVSDGALTDSEDITITVGNVNQPPVLGAIGNKSVNEGQLLTFTLSATDPDGGTLTYSASNLPSGSSFNATSRVFSWTPGFTQAGTYPAVHFQVSDGSLTDSEDITITVVNVNQPPVLSAIGNKSVNEGQLLTFTLSAADPDGGTLTYSASNLPSGSSFDAATRVFSWTPSFTQAGSYAAVHFQVSDGALTDSEDITITVGNVNQPPVLSAIGNKSVNTGVLLTFTLSATDPDGGTLTYSASNLPSGSNFNATTRVFSWTPGSNQAGTYTAVHFQVSDGALTDSEDITITVTSVQGVSYSATIRPMLDQYCSCHVTSTRAPRLNTYANVYAARSTLPGMGSSYLTSQQEQDLAAWISQGAPNN